MNNIRVFVCDNQQLFFKKFLDFSHVNYTIVWNIFYIKILRNYFQIKFFWWASRNSHKLKSINKYTSDDHNDLSLKQLILQLILKI